MKVLVASSEVGSGGGAALNALHPLSPTYLINRGNYADPRIFFDWLRFRSASKEHDVILNYTFPSYFWSSFSGKPSVWYCFEPPFLS